MFLEWDDGIKFSFSQIYSLLARSFNMLSINQFHTWLRHQFLCE